LAFTFPFFYEEGISTFSGISQKAVEYPDVITTLGESLIKLMKDIEAKSIHKGRAGSAAEEAWAHLLNRNFELLTGW
jgi:hypothetical protein